MGPRMGPPERARDAMNHRKAAWQRSARSRRVGVGLMTGLGVLRREKDVSSENKGEGAHEGKREDIVIEWEGLDSDRPAEDKRERKRTTQRRRRWGSRCGD